MAEEPTQDAVGSTRASSRSPTKVEKVPLAELKNGKAVFRQKPVSFEKMSETMQEIVKFREMIEQRIQQGCPPLEKIPETHLPLIAKLVHESDKTITNLTKHILSALQPEDINVSSENDTKDAILSTPQLSGIPIELAILSIADRLNYGIECSDRPLAALCVWRWEVKPQRRDWLPKPVQEKAEVRLMERQNAKRDLNALFKALPQDEQEAHLKGGKKDKGVNLAASAPVNDVLDKSNALQGIDENAHRAADEGRFGKKGPSKPKKDQAVDLDKLAKETERAEKKAAKAEKERKEREAENKSRSILSAFFTKPKSSGPKRLQSPPNPSTAPSTPSSKQIASSSQSDYEKAFKPFVLKKDAIIAPVNWFTHRKKQKEVIVIDENTGNEISKDVARLEDGFRDDLTHEELLNTSLKALSIRTKTVRPLRTRPPSIQQPLRSSLSYCVRSLIAELTEAEVAGDTSAVRHLTDLLGSRDDVPAKILIFHEDTRPGYFGTFTKSSGIIGARRPLKKDAVARDYSHDSGAEWEEEEEGADDLMSLDGSADEEEGSVESDLDDWLVDDDAGEDRGTPLSERAISPGLLPSVSTQKRQVNTHAGSDTSRNKKRKVVVPLVPFSKGPCWETHIGTCEYEPFKALRIQLFNDTPFPIDPFTFVSSPVQLERKRQHVSDNEFSRAPPPASSLSLVHNPNHVNGIASASSTSTLLVPPKRALNKIPQPPPKTPFPDTYLPFLVQKISSLATSNLTFIVESVYQDLKDHKVKKNAIETKVREIGEKSQKIWVVKQDVLGSSVMQKASWVPAPAP